MFQFPGFASVTYVFSAGYSRSCGFPHSDIHGSKPVRGSPWLFAAYHVLHRLSAPRHPPNALTSLDRSHFSMPGQPRRHSMERSAAPARAGNEITGIGKTSCKDLPLHPLGRACGQARPAMDPDDAATRNAPRAMARKVKSLLHNVKDHHRQVAERPANPASSLGLPPSMPNQSTTWWSQTGSNRRPPACKAGALPTELWPRHSRVRHDRADNVCQPDPARRQPLGRRIRVSKSAPATAGGGPG